MKHSTLLTFTAAALLAAGSTYACPNKDKEQTRGEDAQSVYATDAQELFMVLDRDDDDEPREGKKREGKKGEREGKKGEHKKGEGKKGEHRQGPLHGLDLSEEQRKQVKQIMTEAREASQKLMKETKAKKKADEEVDREAVRKQMMQIRKGAMTNVYENVLTKEQQAKFDKRREEMEKRRAENEGKKGEGKKGEGKREGKKRDGKDGDRPERPKKKKGGDDDLDL